MWKTEKVQQISEHPGESSRSSGRRSQASRETPVTSNVTWTQTLSLGPGIAGKSIFNLLINHLQFILVIWSLNSSLIFIPIIHPSHISFYHHLMVITFSAYVNIVDSIQSYSKQFQALYPTLFSCRCSWSYTIHFILSSFDGNYIFYICEYSGFYSELFQTISSATSNTFQL